jgi:hypothetical protein
MVGIDDGIRGAGILPAKLLIASAQKIRYFRVLSACDSNERLRVKRGRVIVKNFVDAGVRFALALRFPRVKRASRSGVRLPSRPFDGASNFGARSRIE